MCSGIRNRARSGALLHSRICISFACCLCGARPSLVAHGHYTGGGAGGGGGTSFTPHTVTLTAGHLAAVPGGSDLAQPKRVFLTATVRGHEMTSYRWLLVLANTRCGVYADVGRGQDLVPVWHLVSAVAILCLPCMLRLSYLGTLRTLFFQLINVFMLLCQATNSLNRGPSTISK